MNETKKETVMSMLILKNAARKTVTAYALEFDRVDEPGCGFRFDCNAEGFVNLPMNPSALANYQQCLTGATQDGTPLVARGVCEHTHSYTEPAIGKCPCGLRVVLHSWTNTCDCGLEYSVAGQLLAPRSQWGEETGESF